MIILFLISFSFNTSFPNGVFYVACVVCFFCNDHLIVWVEEDTGDEAPLVDNGEAFWSNA